MTQADLFRWLLESSCASSAAIVLVLLLRRPLRAAFGASATYLLWSLLPLAVLVASLPAPVVHVPPSDAVAGAGMVALTTADVSAAGRALAPWVLAAWCAGVVASVLSQIAVQRRFRRSLGALHAGGDGLLRAESGAGLPAVLGLRAEIVLPADFELRYSADERALILAHERIHRARGDVAGNMLMTALRCVYWFNPLLWVAVDRFRRDQELACDEAVVARHPNARRAYGEAMVKTQLSAIQAPLACHWFGGHPLKERIAMLKHPVPGKRRMAVGLILAGSVIVGTAYTVWATRPANRVADTASPAMQSVARPQAQPVAPPAGHADAGAHVDVRSKMAAPPKYPADAATNRITGKVLLVIDVAADGSVADARVEKSEPAGVFDQVTLEAAKKWKFSPAMKDGKPVAGRVRVPVHFEMDRDEDAKGNGADGKA